MAKRKPDRLEMEEIDKICEQADLLGDDFYITLLNIMRYTGRRISEYTALQVKDVNLEKGSMNMWILKRKQKIQRETILNEFCVKLLRVYILKNKLKLDDYLFRTNSIRAIQRRIKKFAVDAGINKNVSPHSFRHYFVTSLLKQGWGYDKISKLTGHASPATLVHYDDIIAEDIREDTLAALDRF